jgi:hypothetical protein
LFGEKKRAEDECSSGRNGRVMVQPYPDWVR